MAKRSGKVYLGYEEDVINDKNQTLVNYTVNKIGGMPDWPPLENISFPQKCPLCGLHRVLITQCYATIENSVYHRILYLFACVSPNCWNQSESWACLRLQIQDNPLKETSAVTIPAEANMTWCNNADDWDENDNGDTANGNIMNVDNDNASSTQNGLQRHSDEDEESNSYELESVEQALGNLQMFDAHNANMSPVQGAGAIGAIGAPVAAAELEGGDEPGLVTVDSPTKPSNLNDVQLLLHQTAELPLDLRTKLTLGPLQFLPKYIYVEEEWKQTSANDDRVTELLNKYNMENDVNLEASAGGGGDRDRAGGGADDEQYEEAAPAHGDRLFHAFLTRLRQHPGQILRYSREEPPLLGAPLPSAANSPSSTRAPTVCARCGSRLICELQLVPEFAETLRLLPGNVQLSHLHFLSVLVFTCSQSCWQPNDTGVFETVVLQPEVV